MIFHKGAIKQIGWNKNKWYANIVKLSIVCCAAYIRNKQEAQKIEQHHYIYARIKGAQQ